MVYSDYYGAATMFAQRDIQDFYITVTEYRMYSPTN